MLSELARDYKIWTREDKTRHLLKHFKPSKRINWQLSGLIFFRFIELVCKFNFISCDIKFSLSYETGFEKWRHKEHLLFNEKI